MGAQAPRAPPWIRPWVGGELTFSGLLYKLLVFIVTEDEIVSIVVAN